MAVWPLESATLRAEITLCVREARQIGQSRTTFRAAERANRRRRRRGRGARRSAAGRAGPGRRRSAVRRYPATPGSSPRPPTGTSQVVTGRAATELATNAADGDARPDVAQRPARRDRPRARGRRQRERPDALRSSGRSTRSPFESAWSVTRGRGVIVAVVDSGVEADHQDLAGSVLPGKDYVNPGRRRPHRPQRSRHARRRDHRRPRQQRRSASPARRPT